MQTEPQRIVTALDEYAFIAVEGALALKLLQGQLTCDVNGAAPERVIEGAYCTPKGRVIASFVLWAAAPGRVLLRLRQDIAETTASVLARYAALSRVTLRAEPLICTGLLGEGLEQTAGKVLGAWPLGPLAIVTIGEHQVLQCDATGRRFEVWSPAHAVSPLREALRAHCVEAPASSWRLALVREARVEIVAATAGEFLPQMLDYDRGEAVSFRKGCYTGQEIVARARYKGAVKRRLCRLAGAAARCPAPGDTLHQGDAARAAGVVVESAPAGEARVELLAVLAEEAWQEGAPPLTTADGSVFEVVAGPCAILD
ncbi:MAG: tRNA-modifying protein YgfZ [Pseudomonadales bacterium]|nr:tRNA-modifying protein YgfZ [Pseudomonadales bacterium]